MKIKIFKIPIIITIFLIAGLMNCWSYAEGFPQSLRESQLVKFINGVKKLNVGESTQDDIVFSLGQPHSKNKEGKIEDWGFYYEVTTDTHNDNLENIENRINQLNSEKNKIQKEKEEVIKNIQKITESLKSESEKNAFTKNYFDIYYNKSPKNSSNCSYYELIKKSASIGNNEDAILVNINQFEKEKLKIQYDEKPQKLNCHIGVGIDGRLTNIIIEKIKDSGKETVFEKGERQSEDKTQQRAENLNKGLPDQALLAPNIQPKSPKPGQIYFNSTDSHFYGWNGQEWKQMDK